MENQKQLRFSVAELSFFQLNICDLERLLYIFLYGALVIYGRLDSRFDFFGEETTLWVSDSNYHSYGQLWFFSSVHQLAILQRAILGGSSQEL